MSTRLAAPALALVALVGCASSRTVVEDGGVDSGVSQAALADGPQFEHGKPNKVVDGAGWVFGIPAKIGLWDRRAENHKVSQETETELAEYMAIHGMESTKVRVNQYDPGGEWRRLAANKQVGAGWRYTVGALSTLGYTVLPGRVFSGLVGGDRYNPYTDSIYVYSDIPAVAIEQAAHARNVQARDLPGTYATVFSLPVLRLVPEKVAKDEVYAYVGSFESTEEQVATRRAMYAQFGSEIGGTVGWLVPGSNMLFGLAGAGVGHVVDRVSGPPTARYDDTSMAAALEGKTRWEATQGGDVLQASATEPTGTVGNQAAPISVAEGLEILYR